MGYSTQLLAPGMISMARDPRYMKIGTSSKLINLVISGRFRGLYSTRFLAPGMISMARDPRYTKIGRRQNSSIWPFLAVFVGYSTHFFGFEDDFDGS